MAVQRIENLEQMGEVRAKLNDNFSYLDTKGYPKSEIDEKLATKASIQQLTEKVDKQPNKTLTSNDFTDELKQKLESMEDEHFRGEFVSYEALVEAIPTGNIGDYAYVDEGEGKNVVKYIWDSTDNYRAGQAGTPTEETPQSVRQKYEANPDRNPFLDKYKAIMQSLFHTTGVIQRDSNGRLAKITSDVGEIQVDWKFFSSNRKVYIKEKNDTKQFELSYDNKGHLTNFTYS